MLVDREFFGTYVFSLLALLKPYSGKTACFFRKGFFYEICNEFFLSRTFLNLKETLWGLILLFSMRTIYMILVHLDLF